MALPESDSSNRAGFSDNGSADEDDRQNSVESKKAWKLPINSNRSNTVLLLGEADAGLIANMWNTLFLYKVTII